MLTLTLFLPLLGAVVVGLSDDERTARLVALVASAAAFVASLVVVARFDVGNPDLQLAETFTWIPSFGASFSLAVDGISLLLVVLTTFFTPLILLASGNVTERVKGYLAAFLALETTVLGVFLATDLLAFYVFFEASLIPMYLIIGIWGGANRRYAAVKFFLYTLLGGLLMLVAIVYLYGQAGTFDYTVLRDVELTQTAQRWLFGAFFVAFAVKVPIFPVHTWLPDAHTEAPTAGSVFLAAILLKMGSFGLLRYALPLFPDATVAYVPWILGLAVVGVLYGAVVALMQKDIKKLVAYSSVSHMGFVVLGIFALNATAVSASVVQMVNHGLSTGALFLLIGFLYDRRHTREIAAFSGLAKRVPVMAGFWLVVSMSSLALPGLNGFVGEFPILLGTYQAAPWAGVLAAFGAVLAALYLLWAYQRMFHGPLEGVENETTTDLRPIEIGVLTPLVVLIVLIGIYPKPLYDRVVPSVDRVLAEVGLVEAASTGDVAPLTQK
ncbi:MAG: NADH-quinone oxidoreductase subunit M [Actinomycetes bacterium]